MNIEFTLFVSGGDSTSKRDEKSKKHKFLDITFVNQFFSESTKKMSEQDQIRIFSNSQQTVSESIGVAVKKTQVGEKHRRLQNTTTSSSSWGDNWNHLS